MKRKHRKRELRTYILVNEAVDQSYIENNKRPGSLP